MFSIIKSIALFSFFVLSLSSLGVALNILIPWSWLTDFFIILRHFANLFAFAWDMDTTFQIVGIIFLVESAVMAYRGSMILISFFRSK